MKIDPQVPRLARVLRILTLLGMIGLPIAIAVSFAIGTLGVDDIRDAYGSNPLPDQLKAWQIGVVLLVEAVQLGILLFVLWQIQALFALYAKSETLSSRCADRIVSAAQGLLVMGVAGVVGYTLNVLALTALNPPGTRQLSLNISDTELGFWLAGGLLLIIGWVMRHAARVDDENRGFI